MNGPVVVPFDSTRLRRELERVRPCRPALIDEIIGDPAGFYVNVRANIPPAPFAHSSADARRQGHARACP